MTTLRCILAVFSLFFLFSVKKLLIYFLGDIQITLANAKLYARLYYTVEIAAAALEKIKLRGDLLRQENLLVGIRGMHGLNSIKAGHHKMREHNAKGVAVHLLQWVGKNRHRTDRL